MSVPVAPSAFSRSFKGLGPAGELPTAVRCSWPVPSVGPLVLLGLASSGISHHPVHGTRYSPHLTEPFTSILCSGWFLRVSSLLTHPRSLGSAEEEEAVARRPGPGFRAASLAPGG